ncbi:transposase [Candidatus Moduliflexus flocculans]|uniref:Transposase n=1 Tax=Candidatus Moduliflexus flocculans TaxID=1499966 RepID=A0A0S6VUI9_9BACT|nr:transposase [Candidatus Moduliflexus flocculans]
MNQTTYRIHLPHEDIQHLHRFTTTGAHSARAIRRARILLLADEGASDPAIAEDVGVCLTTVFLTRRRYCQEGLEAVLTERARPGQPRKLSGHGEARLTALACSDPPEGHARWTMTLLADRLVELQVVEAISAATVQRTLKKTT